jgi:general secretion pathway protein K
VRARKGFALLAAIWLCVAIAAVALQFSLEARERRLLGINTSERGKGRSAAVGALNTVQAELDAALRQGPGTGNARLAGARGSDPWLDAEANYSGTLSIDSIPVDIAVTDLGTQLNINNMNENQLRAFFNFALKDFSSSESLTQSILDWRDADSIPRPQGMERDGYIREERLVLPSNQPFREVADLLDVYGMTPEIYERISRYLTTRGTGIINVNSADTLVLRAVPGMTDQVLAQILSQRAMGRRITSLNSILPRGGGRGGRGGGGFPGLNNALQGALTVDVTELQLTLTARVGPQQLPVRLNAILQRQGAGSRITWRQW